jgi:hypothetical protein
VSESVNSWCLFDNGNPSARHLLDVLLPLLEALSRAPDVRPVLSASFDMAGWFRRRRARAEALRPLASATVTPAHSAPM